MTGSREVAEDLVQDAFLRVRVAWTSVRSPGPYVRLAVVNAVREHGRRRTRELRLRREARLPVLPPELDEMWRLLEHLPPRQRQAVVLRFYADLPFAEIAELLGCRLGTAKSLVHRGLGRLKELIT